jgi:hypothetical protein
MFGLVAFVGLLAISSLIGSSWRYFGTGKPSPSPLLLKGAPTQGARQAGERFSASHEPNNHEKIPAENCGSTDIVYPEWPEGFDPGVDAIFIIGVRCPHTFIFAHQCLHAKQASALDL